MRTRETRQRVPACSLPAKSTAYSKNPCCLSQCCTAMSMISCWVSGVACRKRCSRVARRKAAAVPCWSRVVSGIQSCERTSSAFGIPWEPVRPRLNRLPVRVDSRADSSVAEFTLASAGNSTSTVLADGVDCDLSAAGDAFAVEPLWMNASFSGVKLIASPIDLLSAIACQSPLRVSLHSTYI